MSTTAPTKPMIPEMSSQGVDVPMPQKSDKAAAEAAEIAAMKAKIQTEFAEAFAKLCETAVALNVNPKVTADNAAVVFASFVNQLEVQRAENRQLRDLLKALL